MPTAELRGVRVVVTRPAHQAQELSRLIEAEGGEVIPFPVLEISDPPDPAALARLIDRLDEFDIAIFISANAARKALALIEARRAWPARLRIAAVGQRSAEELQHLGHPADIVPRARFDSEALLELPALRDVAGKRIVIFRGNGGRELLATTLAARGARVEYAECYQRLRPEADTAALLARWASDGIDIMVVTSSEGLRNLFEMVGAAGQQRLRNTPLVVMSQRLAAVARELGVSAPVLVAAEASDEALLGALKNWNALRQDCS